MLQRMSIVYTITTFFIYIIHYYLGTIVVTAVVTFNTRCTYYKRCINNKHYTIILSLNV